MEFWGLGYLGEETRACACVRVCVLLKRVPQDAGRVQGVGPPCLLCRGP